MPTPSCAAIHYDSTHDAAGDRCTARFQSGQCRVGVKIGRCGDVRRMTVLPPKAEVHPRSCQVANVPGADMRAKRTRYASGYSILRPSLFTNARGGLL
jgi:hypothetical protein